MKKVILLIAAIFAVMSLSGQRPGQIWPQPQGLKFYILVTDDNGFLGYEDAIAFTLDSLGILDSLHVSQNEDSIFIGNDTLIVEGGATYWQLLEGGTYDTLHWVVPQNDNTLLEAPGLMKIRPGQQGMYFGLNAGAAENGTDLGAVVIGHDALKSAITGAGDATVVGTNALELFQEGIQMTVMGADAGSSLIKGRDCVLIGDAVANSADSIFFSVIIGAGAPALNAGHVIGATYVGYNIAKNNDEGHYNTAIGHEALRSLTSGDNVTSVGRLGMYSLTTGNNCINLGATNGGTLTTGNNVYLFGVGVDVPSPSTSDYMSIGNLIYANGGFGSGTTNGLGNVGIKTNAATTDFDVNGLMRMRSGSAADYIIQGDANGVFSWVDPSTLFSGEWTLNGTDLYPTTGINIGLGTTSPLERLHINNGAIKLSGDDNFTGGEGPKIYNDSDLGFVVQAGTGNTHDFYWATNSGSNLFNVPTGTTNLVFGNSASNIKFNGLETTGLTTYARFNNNDEIGKQTGIPYTDLTGVPTDQHILNTNLSSTGHRTHTKNHNLVFQGTGLNYTEFKSTDASVQFALNAQTEAYHYMYTSSNSWRFGAIGNNFDIEPNTTNAIIRIKDLADANLFQMSTVDGRLTMQKYTSGGTMENTTPHSLATFEGVGKLGTSAFSSINLSQFNNDLTDLSIMSSNLSSTGHRTQTMNGHNLTFTGTGGKAFTIESTNNYMQFWLSSSTIPSLYLNESGVNIWSQYADNGNYYIRPTTTDGTIYWRSNSNTNRMTLETNTGDLYLNGGNVGFNTSPNGIYNLDCHFEDIRFQSPTAGTPLEMHFWNGNGRGWEAEITFTSDTWRWVASSLNGPMEFRSNDLTNLPFFIDPDTERVGLGGESNPQEALDNAGKSVFQDDIYVNEGLFDSNDSDGNDGDFLTSTGDQTEYRDNAFGTMRHTGVDQTNIGSSTKLDWDAQTVRGVSVDADLTNNRWDIDVAGDYEVCIEFAADGDGLVETHVTGVAQAHDSSAPYMTWDYDATDNSPVRSCGILYDLTPTDYVEFFVEAVTSVIDIRNQKTTFKRLK